MRWTVGMLALLSTIGGFLQFSPVWHPLTTWLEPVTPALVDPTGSQEAVASIVAVGVGLIGIAVAWAIYAAKRREAPKPVRAFEKKFYWDELYDWLWYYPADLVSRGLYALVERPLIAGSMSAVTAAFGLGSTELGRAQNGLVRTYALALAGSVAILAIVFVSVR
jgi:NADH-quinone oxidoreductase subunit L